MMSDFNTAMDNTSKQRVNQSQIEEPHSAALIFEQNLS